MKSTALLRLVFLAAGLAGPIHALAGPADGSGGFSSEKLRPTAKDPFSAPLDKSKQKEIEKTVRAYMNQPPGSVRAHPAAADFPGVAPKGAPHVTRTLSFHGTNLRIPENSDYGAGRPWSYWQSTGLYAQPGETVTIKAKTDLPKDAVVEIQIGCHTDDLFNCETRDDGGHMQWMRFPKITRYFPMKQRTLSVACAFGGQIFVTVRLPDKKSAAKAILELEFANAIEAPHFELGKTTPEAWLRERAKPAPWGELAGRSVIIHAPTDELRKLADPAPILAFLDAAVAAEDRLAGWTTRTGPDRIVLDREIEGGSLHSGYPIMGYLDALPGYFNAEKLTKEGDWGLFHELGHNHQSGDWTFDHPMDQTEVTVNLFSLYCMEKLCHRARGGGHREIEGKGLLEALTRRFADKPSDNAFDQLTPFVVLLHRYGWEPLEKTLASYQTRPIAQDASEPDRQAEFIERYSRNASADLSAFFMKMGYACPAPVRARLKKLPAFDFAAWCKAYAGSLRP